MNQQDRKQVVKAILSAAKALEAGSAVKAGQGQAPRGANLQGASMGQLKVIDSIGKGRKIGSYDPVEIIEALKLLDPKWSIEETTGVVSAHNYGDVKDWVTAIFKLKLPRDTHVSPAFTKNEPYELLAKDRESREEAEALLPFVEKLFIKVSKKGPLVAKLGQLYTSGEIGVKRWGANMWCVAVHQVMLGVPVWKITAPEGQVLELAVTPDRKGNYDSRNMSKPTIWTWLYKKVPGLQEAAREFVAGSSLEKKQARQKLLKKGKPGDFGTCAVCDKVFKMKRGAMVLHGFQRPGYGYIIGNCLGVGYEPYEVSPEGCKYAASMYDRLAKKADQDIQEMPRRKKLYVGASYRAYIVYPDGTVEELERRSPEYKKVGVSVRYDEWRKGDFWKAAVEAHRESLRKVKQEYESERDRMILKIKEWKEAPLPGTE